jgi:elongation factor G
VARTGSDARRPGRDLPPAPEPRPAAQVRNVVVVGPSGSGKTTLLEALLARTGAVARPGRVDEGTSVLDGDQVARRRRHTVALGAASVDHADVTLNLLDTPGHPDLVGEVRAGLRAADAALFVVSAVGGLDARTTVLWEECAAVGMPRALVVSQLDRPRADFDEAVALGQRLLGEGVHPLLLPLHGDGGEVAGVLDLVRLRLSDWTSGGPEHRDPDPEHLRLVEGLRADLLEAVIAESEDETLLDRYLAGEDLDPQVVVQDVERAVARGHFHPVLAVAPLTGAGTAELLDLLVAAFPSPLEHGCPPVSRPDGSPAAPLACDPDGPLAAEVVRTTTDPYLGRVSLLRVFSGTLRPDTAVHVSGHGGAERGHPDHDQDERVGPLSAPLGRHLRPVAACPAGGLCAVVRLTSAETGDTLSSVDEPLLVAAWDLPEPQHPVAVEAATPADEADLAAALARLTAEDPVVRLERREGTGQLLLWCLGDTHAEVLLERLRTRGADVVTPPVRVPLLETLAGPARATGRHVKQSGGHGQYAVVVVEAEPLPPGSGVVVEQRIVGGAVPAAFHGSVEKGVRAQAARGTGPEGRPLVDVRVVLVDGKAHAVDSSDAAFTAAGALALREVAAAAGTTVLEPWVAVEVEVPAPFVGPVMGDLAGRRAHVTGSEPDPDTERVVVRAELPEAELLGYAAALRAVSHGTGRSRRRPLGHRPAP